MTEFKIRDRATGNIVTMGELDSATVDKDGFLVQPNNPFGTDLKGNVVFMDTKPTDAEIAQALREDMAAPLKEICRILDVARAAGMKADFAIMQDQFGRFIPPHVIVTKAL